MITVLLILLVLLIYSASNTYAGPAQSYPYRTGGLGVSAVLLFALVLLLISHWI